MNRYPSWLNALVLIILLSGCLFALPNIYGSVPAVQIADNGGSDYDDSRIDEFLAVVADAGVAPDAAFVQDGRVVIRFESSEDQALAAERLKSTYRRDASVAATLAPRLPAWLRGLGLNPMSLGLDLRGGVYVLLEVDMASAIDKRMESYRQDFDDRLRDARIRHRVDLNEQVMTVRLTGSEDMQSARDIIERADSDVLVSDGADGKSLTVRMSQQQIQDRQNFAIEQNLTTLRNRVNQLGVAEPLDEIPLRLEVPVDGRGCGSVGAHQSASIDQRLVVVVDNGVDAHALEQPTRVRQVDDAVVAGGA